jgi:DNA-binding GntR family transcriptional regulator
MDSTTPPTTERPRPVPGLDAIDHENLGDIVYAKLSAALMEGALRPGERLRIRDLAQQMGTSVTPVRDAILRLVQEQVLILRSLRDIRVPSLTLPQYLEIRDIRIELEGLAAERAAARAAPKDLKLLERLIRQNETAIRRGDTAAAIALNEQFHLALPAIAGLPTLAGILKPLWMRMGPLISELYEAGGRSMIEHHYPVLEAIRAGDGPAARRAIAQDILKGGEVILQRKLLEAEAPPHDQ